MNDRVYVSKSVWRQIKLYQKNESLRVCECACV